MVHVVRCKRPDPYRTLFGTSTRLRTGRHVDVESSYEAVEGCLGAA
jgi:hypothetical protein